VQGGVGQRETAGVWPPLPFLLFRHPRDPCALLESHNQNGPQRFLESLLTREVGCSSANPSLSRAPQDGAEQDVIG
jgi:hypothetical protein